MADVLYKDRLIGAFARFDEITASWIPMVDVSWETDGQRELHTINGPLDPFRKLAGCRKIYDTDGESMD